MNSTSSLSNRKLLSAGISFNNYYKKKRLDVNHLLQWIKSLDKIIKTPEDLKNEK